MVYFMDGRPLISSFPAEKIETKENLEGSEYREQRVHGRNKTK